MHLAEGKGGLVAEKRSGHAVLRVQRLGFRQALLALFSARAGVDLAQYEICLQAEGELLQDAQTEFLGLDSLFVFPQRLGQGNLQVNAVGVFFEEGPELLYGAAVAPTAGVQTGQGSRCQVEPTRLYAGLAAVEPAQFVADSRVVRGDFESSLHVPEGLVQIAPPIIDHAHARMGDEVLRIPAEHSGEHVLRLILLPGLQHRLAQHPVDLQVFGILFEDVAAVGDDLIVSSFLDQLFHLPNIFMQSDFSHHLPSRPGRPQA